MDRTAKLLGDIMSCRSADSYKERQECEDRVNLEIADVLAEMFPETWHGCDIDEYDRKNIGNFIIETINMMGHKIEDVKRIEPTPCLGHRNVFALDFGSGKKVWIKSAGGNRPIALDEVVYTSEAEAIARLLGEDAPVLINYKLEDEKYIMALSDMSGKEMGYGEGYYKEFSPTELATSMVFEAILMDADRAGRNVIQEGNIIKEIDIAAIMEVRAFDEFIDRKFSNVALKSLMGHLKNLKDLPENDRQFMRDLRKNVLNRIEVYKANKWTLSVIAPHICDKKKQEAADELLAGMENYFRELAI